MGQKRVQKDQNTENVCKDVNLNSKHVFYLNINWVYLSIKYRNHIPKIETDDVILPTLRLDNNMG